MRTLFVKHYVFAGILPLLSLLTHFNTIIESIQHSMEGSNQFVTGTAPCLSVFDAHWATTSSSRKKCITFTRWLSTHRHSEHVSHSKRFCFMQEYCKAQWYEIIKWYSWMGGLPMQFLWKAMKPNTAELSGHFPPPLSGCLIQVFISRLCPNPFDIRGVRYCC